MNTSETNESMTTNASSANDANDAIEQKRIKRSITEGNPVFIYFFYALPWTLGLLASSSAGIVDGYFIGNYVGGTALAAVNIITPIYSFIFSISLMFTAGGAVRFGKYKGEKKPLHANAIFIKIMITIAIFCFLFTTLCGFFPEKIVQLLGAKDELVAPATLYLKTIVPFFVSFIGLWAFSYFARTDGNPILASVAMFVAAGTNMFLDWLFLAKLGFGIEGAALATGTAFTLGFLLILTHFFSKKCTLKFTKRLGSWKEIFSAAYNGLSEFTNEVSTGVIVLLFNWTLITELGTAGITAFTVINYMFWAGVTISFGLADSLQPLVSTNFGAKQPARIRVFLKCALITVFCTGIVLSAILAIFPENILAFFLPNADAITREISLEFAQNFWPAFLFLGVSITVTAYLTSMQRPLPSAVVSLSRSFIFPAIMITVLPQFMGDRGIFLAIPIGEAITFLIAIFFIYYARPEKFIK